MREKTGLNDFANEQSRKEIGVSKASDLLSFPAVPDSILQPLTTAVSLVEAISASHPTVAIMAAAKKALKDQINNIMNLIYSVPGLSPEQIQQAIDSKEKLETIQDSINDRIGTQTTVTSPGIDITAIAPPGGGPVIITPLP